MQTNSTNTPTEMNEATLDGISGGPHFRNFHGAAFDFQSGCDTVLVKQTGSDLSPGNAEDEAQPSVGHYTQMAWSKTR